MAAYAVHIQEVSGRTEPSRPGANGSLGFHKPKDAGSIINRIAYAFVPQYFRTKYFHGQRAPPKLSSTSYLDGMRGVAALIVFNFHYCFAFTPITDFGYIASDRFEFWKFMLQLPVLRIWSSGRAMVYIFFAVSGFVLSNKPLRLLSPDHQSRDKHKDVSSSRPNAHKPEDSPDSIFCTVLASSLFRRLPRLYLPVMIWTLIIAHAAYFGTHEALRPFVRSKDWFPGTISENQLSQIEYWGHLKFWWEEMLGLTNVLDWWTYYPRHDQHLFTVPLEAKGGLVLGLTLLLVSNVRSGARRLALLFACSWFAMYRDRWEAALYIWGACIAQYNILCEELDGLPPSRSSSLPPIRLLRGLLASPAVLYGGITVSLWMLTQPHMGQKTALGYTIAHRYLPNPLQRQERFLPAIGAALFILCVSRLKPSSSRWHRLFSSDFAQYMGRNMFAFYLVHGPIFHMFGYRVPHLVWAHLSPQYSAFFCVGLFAGWAWSLTVALCIADVFTREVDARCVRFSRWLEARACGT